MTLPQTYIATLVLMIFGIICWGSWANAFKLGGNWRFELFYFDFSLGVILIATVAAFTLGTLGSDGFQFEDDLLQTSKHNFFYAILGGVVFNLANLFLLAAVSLMGMAISFTAGLGMALVVGVIWNYAMKPQGSVVLLFAGAAIVLAAVVVALFAYKTQAAVKLEMQAKAGLLKTSSPTVSPKGIVLSLVGGAIMGGFLPLVEMSRTYGGGLGPYSIAFLFATGVFTSTFIFLLFFMNLPVQGQPVEVRDYWRKGTLKRHMLGILSGAIWCVGAIANFVGVASEQAPKLGVVSGYVTSQGAAIIAVLWGLFVWKEFSEADYPAKSLLYVMMALFVCGLGMVSIAPLYLK